MENLGLVGHSINYSGNCDQWKCCYLSKTWKINLLWIIVFFFFFEIQMSGKKKSDYPVQILKTKTPFINKYHNNLIYFISRFTHIDTFSVYIFILFLLPSTYKNNC